MSSYKQPNQFLLFIPTIMAQVISGAVSSSHAVLHQPRQQHVFLEKALLYLLSCCCHRVSL